MIVFSGGLMNLLLTVLLLITLIFPTYAQNINDVYQETAGTIIKTALEDQKGYQLLHELCKIGPRLGGYPGSYAAIDWCAAQLDSLGCDRVWLHSVMIPYWNRGEIEEAFFTFDKDSKPTELSIAALGGSIGTPSEGISAQVLEVHSFEELLEKSEQARGKIIFFNRPFDKTVFFSFAGYGGAVRQRTHGAVEAAKVGGLASLVRSVTSLDDNVPHTGVMYYEEGTQQIPSAALGVLDANKLSHALKIDPSLKITLKLSCENLPEVESFNVIGEIKGSKYPDEVIVVGGHLDAWDKGDGAHDDGAGCIQAIEVLYLLKKLGIQPSRTIRCVLFMDEEQHQSGAKAYGYYASYTAQKHLAAIESDRGAFTPRGFNVTADSLIIQHMHSWLPYLKNASIDWIRKGGSGPDISRIKNATALIGYVPDGQRYFDFHHSANDVVEAVHPRELELGSAAMTILAYLISEEGLESDARR
jgi:hypothetical protein